MKITHIKLDYWKHFLVVDMQDGSAATRGPVQDHRDAPAFHPAGFWRFRSDAGYPVNDLASKMFTLSSYVAEEVAGQKCEPAEKARNEWITLENACQEIQIARFEPAIPEEK